MGDWFSALSGLEKTFWVFAIVGGIAFIIILLLTLMGGDADADMDVDSEIESDTGAGFQFLTVKNIIAFFAIFGWTGIACMDAGMSNALSVIIATVAGTVMMALMAAIFFYMSRLQDSGTLNLNNAVGLMGEVYLTVKADRGGIGKVHIRIQGALRELEALTDENTDLTQGTVIRVSKVSANGILIIEKESKK